MAPETKHWHNHLFFSYLFSPKSGNAYRYCEMYYLPIYTWNDRGIFRLKWLFIDAVLIYLNSHFCSLTMFTTSTYVTEMRDCFVHKSCFKTDKLVSILKGSAHKGGFKTAPRKHLSCILDILFVFLIWLGILYKVPLLFVVLGYFAASLLGGWENGLHAGSICSKYFNSVEIGKFWSRSLACCLFLQLHCIRVVLRFQDIICGW